MTGALKLLSDKGLINYEPYGVITMTPEGKKTAEEVVRRHEVLEVRAKGYHRSIRSDDAERILVDPL
ncbi:MAG: hypothetical protein R6V25_03700 [Desulfatiglandales bacterium]